MRWRKVRNENLWILRNKDDKLLQGIKLTYAPRGIAENPYVVTRSRVGKGIVSKQYLKSKKEALKKIKSMIGR